MNYRVKKTALLFLLSAILTAGALTACNNRSAANAVVELSERQMTLSLGEAKKLTVSVLPEDATDKEVAWESSDEGVARVENGVVTAVGAGEAVVTVRSNRKSDSCKVIVRTEKDSGRSDGER